MWVEQYEHMKKLYKTSGKIYYEKVDEENGYTTLLTNFDYEIDDLDEYFEDIEFGISYNDNEDIFKLKYILHFNEDTLKEINIGNLDFSDRNILSNENIFWLEIVSSLNRDNDNNLKATLHNDSISIETIIFANKENDDHISTSTFNNLLDNSYNSFMYCLKIIRKFNEVRKYYSNKP